MEYILKSTHISSQWVFIVSLLTLSYFSFLKIQFGKRLELIFKSSFSQKSSNQFLRETNNQLSALFLLPIFVFVFSLIMTHPNINGSTSWSLSSFLFFFIFLSVYFILKFLLIQLIGFLFEKTYLFEEINFHSYLFETIGGIVLFPFVMLSIYSPLNSYFMIQFCLGLFFILVFLKWSRMIFLSFFRRSFFKTHIIVYLCLLEFLPLLLFINKFFRF